jgi:hypothetical protein
VSDTTPNQPLTPMNLAAALSEVDEQIDDVRRSLYLPEYTNNEDTRHIVGALNDLTGAMLAIAKGVRLLAEPPPVEIAETPRAFVVFGDDEGLAEDQSDPR